MEMLTTWLVIFIQYIKNGITFAMEALTAWLVIFVQYTEKRASFVKELPTTWVLLFFHSFLALVILIALSRMSSKVKELKEAAAIRQTRRRHSRRAPRDLPITLDGWKWVVDYKNIALREGHENLDRISLDGWKWVAEYRTVALREGYTRPNTSSAGNETDSSRVHWEAPASTDGNAVDANSNSQYVDPRILKKHQRSLANDLRRQKILEQLPLKKIMKAYESIKKPVTKSQQSHMVSGGLPPRRVTKSIVALPTSRNTRSDMEEDVNAHKQPEGVPYEGRLLPNDVVVKQDVGANSHLTIYRSKVAIDEDLRQRLEAGTLQGEDIDLEENASKHLNEIEHIFDKVLEIIGSSPNGAGARQGG
ncbi:MAG: hypothetical protein M1831_000181 [Alyxoria varia]|nr:MAG: hypothetical protein M1831_000181 [Alyxoria varia]